MSQPSEIRSRLSPCLEWIFAESEDFAARLLAAREHDLGYVEFWYWRRRGADELKAARDAAGIGISAIVVDPQAPIADRANHKEWLANVAESAKVASDLGSPILVATAGARMDTASVSDQMDAVYEALAGAAEIAGDNGVRIALEPLNDRVDHPGTLLTSSLVAGELVDKVGADSLGILLDIYHAFAMGEDVPQVVAQLGARIAHVQVADHPGRHEPGTGEIPWAEVMKALDGAGYRGPIGLEYKPTMPSPESLALAVAALGAS